MGELIDKTKGRAKEAAGAVTGNERLRQEGRADQVKGGVKGKANDVADSASDKLRDAADKVEETARRHT